MAGHWLGVVGVMVVIVGTCPPITDSAIAQNSVPYSGQWGEWQPWVICTGEYCGPGKRSRLRKEHISGQSKTTPGPVGGTMDYSTFDPPEGPAAQADADYELVGPVGGTIDNIPIDPPEGTAAQAYADYEFFSSSCPVKDSILGFKFQTISALGVAALANASEDIGTFLEIGCDPNFNKTFLTYIKTKCENPIFEKLGIPCARQVKIEGYTPLILAVLYGTAATVQKLSEIPGINLEAMINLDANSNLYSPLWMAAKKGNMEMVRSLVEAGANLEVSGGKYLTKPLGEAVLFGSVEMVRYLISNGAYVDSRDINEATPANDAVSLGNLQILKILKASGVDLDGVHGIGDVTLLILAAAKNQADIVDYLISQKVDVNKQNEDGRSALVVAAINNYLNILQSLVRAGADLNVLYGPQQLSSLSYAIVLDNSDVALFLIQSGADVNSRSSEGFSASFIAAETNNLPILEALADAEANLETKGGPLDMTPLAFAALKGHLDIVQYLTAKGVNRQATNKDGQTALDLAREYGNDDVVKFLEEK